MKFKHLYSILKSIMTAFSISVFLLAGCSSSQSDVPATEEPTESKSSVTDSYYKNLYKNATFGTETPEQSSEKDGTEVAESDEIDTEVPKENSETDETDVLSTETTNESGLISFRDFSDYRAIYDDLTKKLESLYGEGELYSDKYRTTITWIDSESNQIRLLINADEDYVTLGYMAADADARLDKMQEALDAEIAASEAADREANADNVNGL
jgi:hypothetical protein